MCELCNAGAHLTQQIAANGGVVAVAGCSYFAVKNMLATRKCMKSAKQGKKEISENEKNPQ